MKKRETASKVDDPGGFSEVDAKGSFSFFHCASVGVSKDLRCFLLFPLRAVEILPAIFKKKPFECYFQDVEKKQLGKKHISSPSASGARPSSEINGGGFQLLSHTKTI
ncbi:hypothetical protein ABE237_05090 [Brevibacillus formosus]|uniref:hypothetical protein n=1 Tax=Brevibacillus TaxID=55080 RepID=UPI000D10C156|nr:MULTISPECIES: hypothetical protein [Brevibacillus]MBG9941338.1 hypothetical protein [Brevibacillus formosus]MED1948913.1 hypothetical protein [Brevibacillus formosus]MED2001436.1 hypothetical protein [Brevibacillus formosus]MED2085521.1 hypothetical protein [Brevibacillus formosus]PSK11460.1 hypothetical protein C7R94_26190 [Brevibacillus sp. NRRL NRS-603]